MNTFEEHTMIVDDIEYDDIVEYLDLPDDDEDPWSCWDIDKDGNHVLPIEDMIDVIVDK